MRISDWSSDVCSSDLHVDEVLDDREHRLGRIGEHAALDPLQQPVGLIAGKIRLEAQAARAGLDRKSKRLDSSHQCASRMPSSPCKHKLHPHDQEDTLLHITQHYAHLITSADFKREHLNTRQYCQKR